MLPPGWIAEATRARADSPQVGFGKLEPDDPSGYGYQWWVLPPKAPYDGAFMAEGIFGQYIYINPKAHLVIVAVERVAGGLGRCQRRRSGDLLRRRRRGA